MRVALLTREYPPEIYGGAGVHVAELSRVLATRVDLDVHCFGAPRRDVEPGAQAYEPWEALAGADGERAALRVLSVDLAMASAVAGVDVVHSHTWYANLGGHLAHLAWGIPHVVTTHSLEPLRPWKAEQLGGGYAVSSFAERVSLEGASAVIAVSDAMRADVLACYPAIPPGRVRVVHNGIDPHRWAPTAERAFLLRRGIDPARPIVAFVGRVTRQKGIRHLLAAARALDPRAQLVCCAGAADTPALAAEVDEAAAALRDRPGGFWWIPEMLSHEELVELLSAATVFACPSIYEPFGLVNLEAMACETAVVATAVGGIPEVVTDGVTGTLVPVALTPDGSEAAEPEALAAALAEGLNALVADPDRAHRMGLAGRARVLEHFSWEAIADRTVALYEAIVRGSTHSGHGGPRASTPSS